MRWTEIGAGDPAHKREPKLTSRCVLIAVFALVSCALIWAVVLSTIESERAQEVSAINRENANLARAFEEHVRRTLRYVDQLALQGKRLAERQGGAEEWARLFEQVGSRDETVTLIAMANEHGYILRASRPTNTLNLAPAAHFQIHQAEDTSDLHIGRPILGRVSKQWVIPLTRRINKPDGSFGGIVTVAVAANYFSDYYRRLDLGAQGTVSLVGRDGVVRARQSGPDKTPGQDTSSSILLELAGEQREGSFFSPFRVDSVPRLVSFRALADYPLTVLVGRAKEEALAHVEARRTTYLLGAAGMTLLLLAFCLALVRSFVKDQRALRKSAHLRAEGEAMLARLRESELRYRQLIEDLPEAIVITQQGIVQFVNEAAMQLIGAANAAEIVGAKVAGFVGPAGVATATEKIKELNQAEIRLPQWELQLRRIDGSTFDAEFSSVSFLKDGKIVVQHIIRDITARKQAADAVQEANAQLEQRVAERTAQLEMANRELETFSYSVSHDLRAPLRAINGFARILKEHLGGSLDAEGRRLLGRIESGAQRMSTLINSLLEFASAGRAELSYGSVDLAEITASVVAEVGSAYPGADVEIGSLPRTHGDATLLREVMVNLIDNAFKYSSKSARPRIEIGSLSELQGAAIFVRDNGAGFDPARAENLFAPFRRLHSEAEFPGTGIGLALCERIIERHGGRIWAESAPGKGAIFYFSLSPGQARPAAGPTTPGLITPGLTTPGPTTPGPTTH